MVLLAEITCFLRQAFSLSTIFLVKQDLQSRPLHRSSLTTMLQYVRQLNTTVHKLYFLPNKIVHEYFSGLNTVSICTGEMGVTDHDFQVCSSNTHLTETFYFWSFPRLIIQVALSVLMRDSGSESRVSVSSRIAYHVIINQDCH